MPTSRVKKLVMSASTQRLVLVIGASGSRMADIPLFSNMSFFFRMVLKRFSVKEKHLHLRYISSLPIHLFKCLINLDMAYYEYFVTYLIYRHEFASWANPSHLSKIKYIHLIIVIKLHTVNKCGSRHSTAAAFIRKKHKESKKRGCA